MAERTSPGGDAARQLTPDGQQLIRLQARAFARAAFGVDVVWTSPFTRAVQTAEAVAQALGVPLIEQPLLRSGCSFEDVRELIDREGAFSGVMLVGHQPDLGRIVQSLTACRIPVRTGTLVVVEAERIRPMGGHLVGLYDPEVMARLGHASASSSL